METNFGDRLKAVRKQNGITQAKLANTLGISEYSIIRYEKSQSYPTYKQLLRLEEFFGVSLHPTYAQEECSKAVSIQCEDTPASKVAEAFSPEQVALLKQMLREIMVETLREFITEFDSFNKAFRGTPSKVYIDRGKEVPTHRMGDLKSSYKVHINGLRIHGQYYTFEGWHYYIGLDVEVRADNEGRLFFFRDGILIPLSIDYEAHSIDS